MTWGAVLGPATRITSPGQPQIEAAFDLSTWRALLKEDREIGQIADKLKSLGQKWVDVFAQSYLALNDKEQLPRILKTLLADARRELELTSNSDRRSDETLGQPQLPTPCETLNDRSQALLPGTSGTNIAAHDGCFSRSLLKAADAIEGTKTHVERLLEALRYFADLGSGEASKDFAKVRQNLLNTRELISSSPPILAIIQGIAVELRGIVAEEATQRASLPIADVHPVAEVHQGAKQQDEVNIRQVDGALGITQVDGVLGNRRSEAHSAVQVDDSLASKNRDEQERVDTVLSEIKDILNPKDENYSAVPVNASLVRKEENKPEHVLVVSAFDRREGRLSEGGPAIPPQVPPMRNQEVGDPFREEIEALLGTGSVSSLG